MSRRFGWRAALKQFLAERKEERAWADYAKKHPMKMDAMLKWAKEWEETQDANAR